MSARRYLLLVTIVVTVAFAVIAGLNLFVDPYGSADDDQPFRLGTEQRATFDVALPDYGRSRQLRHIAASRATVLLLGTSRTLFGLPRDLRDVDNAGRAAGTLQDMQETMHVAAVRAAPPRVYILEAVAVPRSPGSASREADGTNLGQRLFAGSTTDLSLALLWSHFRPSRPFDRPGRYVPPNSYGRYAFVDEHAGNAMTSVKAMLETMLSDCGRNRATLLVFEPPHRKVELIDAASRHAILTRMATYRRVLAAAAAPRACTARFLDMSGLDPAGRDPAAFDDAHWYDWSHFDTEVGTALFQRLIRSSPRSPAGPAQNSRFAACRGA